MTRGRASLTRSCVPHPGRTYESLPRTASYVPDRRGRLMALGNGLVPQQFALALQMLTELSPREVM